MNGEPLKKHIIDTVKEWQMKIGYRPESMKLYYPAVSLAELLDLPEDAGKNSFREHFWDLQKKKKLFLENFPSQKKKTAGS